MKAVYMNDERDFSDGKGRSREGKHGLMAEVEIQVTEDAPGDGVTVTFKYHDKTGIVSQGGLRGRTKSSMW